jgi:hypothetical protein
MITEDHIKKQLEKHRAELATLQVAHDNMVKSHQQRCENFNALVIQNQIRFQQLSGAISELEELLKPQNEHTNNGDGDMPSDPVSRVSGALT